MKSILVPIDFSVHSLNAITLAEQLARKTEGTIFLLHVIEIPIKGYSSMDEIREDDMENIYSMHFIDIIRKKIDKLREDHQSPSFKIKTVLKLGDPYDEIVRVFKDEKIDIIFIGSKGVSNHSELFLGSLCEKVLRTVQCPIITTKEVSVANRFKKILYATDLRNDQEHVFDTIKTIQSLFDSHIEIVKINTRENFMSDIDNMIELEKLTEKFEIQDFSLNVFNHTNEEDGIVYFAEMKNVDLIVVGIHERTGIRRLISGGVPTEDIAEHSRRPVLTYHIDIKEE